MTFKEQLEMDRGIFINPDELAEIVIIDGVEVAAVYSQQPIDDRENGIYSRKDELFVASSFFDAIPVPGMRLKINDSYLTVQTAKDIGGICHIVFEGVDS